MLCMQSGTVLGNGEGLLALMLSLDRPGTSALNTNLSFSSFTSTAITLATAADTGDSLSSCSMLGISPLRIPRLSNAEVNNFRIDNLRFPTERHDEICEVYAGLACFCRSIEQSSGNSSM